MIRESKRHRKNLFHRMLSVMLALALAVVSALGTGRGIRAASGDDKVIYLDGVSGDNSRDGQSEEEAVATFSRAKKLVGDKGTIRVCGTVTVSDSQSWSLGSGVKLKRAYGFSDAVAHVTGSLKLSGISLYNTDVTGSGSVSGLAGRSPASEISVPATITLVQPKALAEVSLSDQCFGTGSFVWADGSFVPDKYETQAQIIFTPSDTDVHDYSGLKGWNGDSQTVIRKVKVLTQSFLEDEKTEDGSEQDEAGADEKAEDGSKPDGTDGDFGKEDDGKSDGSSAKEEGKADSDSVKDDEKTDSDSDKKAGKTDGSSDKEAGKTDSSSDKEAGKADGKPDSDSDKAGSDSDKADRMHEDGKTDGDLDIAAQNPEDGKTDASDGTNAEGSDAPDGDQITGDDSESPEEGGEAADLDSREKPVDETEDDTSGEQPDAEDKKDEPAETWNVEKVEKLLAKLPDSIGSQSDVDAVVRASKAYEQLSEEDQAAVSGELLEQLYDAQSRVLGYNRVSLGVTIQGDLPWYIQFRASIVEGQKIDDSTIRTLLESYEFQLWNLITDSEYKLSGKTVIVRMTAPAVKDTDIVIYHYLEDGTVEQIIPEIDGDQMSFVTSSFSPFSVIGVSVAGSTELVGSTGFSYIDKTPKKDEEGSSTGNKNSTNNAGNTGNGNSNINNSSNTGNKGNGSGSTGNSSSSSSQSSSSSKSQTGNSNTSNRNTSTKRATAVGTGDTNNLLGYALIGSGSAVLMLFAAYMVYVQYKRKSYSRRS